MLLAGLSQKNKVLRRKVLLKKQEKNPGLNQFSAVEAWEHPAEDTGRFRCQVAGTAKAAEPEAGVARTGG